MKHFTRTALFVVLVPLSLVKALPQETNSEWQIITGRGVFSQRPSTERDRLLLLEARGYDAINRSDIREAEQLYRSVVLRLDRELGPQEQNIPSALVEAYYYYGVLLWQVDRQPSKSEFFIRKAIDLAPRAKWTELPAVSGEATFVWHANLALAFIATERRDFKRAAVTLAAGMRLFDSDASLAASIRLSDSEETLSAVALGGAWLATELALRGKLDTSVAYEAVLDTKARSLVDFSLRINSLKAANGLDAIRRYMSLRSQFELHPQTLTPEMVGRLPFLLRDSMAARLYRTDESRKAAFWQTYRPLTSNDITSRVPRNSVFLDYCVYRNHSPHSQLWENPRYAVYVLRQSALVRVIDLGPADEIDREIRSLRKKVSNPATHSSDATDSARRLYQRIVAPVEKYLTNREVLIVSPDGLMNILPFAALIDSKHNFLVQDLALAYVASGRELNSRPETAYERINLGPPVVVGYPEFGMSEPPANHSLGSLTKLLKEASSRQTLPDIKDSIEEIEAKTLLTSTFLQFDSDSIAGTREEITAVGKTVGAKPIFGRDATEEFLKSVRSPSIFHIATHGFFIPADEVSIFPEPDFLLRWSIHGSRKADERVSPMFRSGLALAGANRLSDGTGEDGLLTAGELALIDLAGTELVVLSACDTGVGETGVGEGVFGLIRSLTVAGSRSQVVTLWSINDEATRDLMVQFYRNLQAGTALPQALRRAQLAMLSHHLHPFYWAAFIYSGDLGSLR